jgi:D-serine deaminase-like pyridoxal phosphate-dependent protein
MSISAAALKESLCKAYVGQVLLEVPTPSAILDVSKIKRNCSRMLEAVDKLDFGWRAHIKTHKVTKYLH